jgi:hypothetical protein
VIRIAPALISFSLAHFVVLADDTHTIDPEKIKESQVVRNVVGE